MPKQIQTGHVTQSLQRAFGFKGQFKPMLDELIVPVYVIADPTPAQVQRLCAGTRGAIVPTDLDRPFVQLFNPPDSGVLASVTSVIASSDVKHQLNVAFFDTPGVQVGTAHFRDRRNQGNPSCELRNTETETTNQGDIIAVLQVDGTLSQTSSWVATPADPRQPLSVLPPGRGLIVQLRSTIASVAGDNMRVNFRWLEVPIWDIRPESGLP